MEDVAPAGPPTPARRRTAKKPPLPTFLEPALPKIEPAEDQLEPSEDQLEPAEDQIARPTEPLPLVTVPEPRRPVRKRAPAKKATAAIREPPPPPSEPAPEPALQPTRVAATAPDADHTESVAGTVVRELGPEARDWATWMHGRYPDATAGALARLASAHFVRLAYRRGALAGASGAFGRVTGTVLVAQVQARLVLHVAAAYGTDPTSEERTAELATLLRVPRVTEPTGAAAVEVGRLISGYAITRVASRIVPFGLAALGSLTGGRGTEAVAARAIQFYRSRAPK